MDEEQKTHENTSTAFLSLKAELLRKQKDLQKSSFSSNVESSSILENLQSSSSSLKLKTQLELDLEVVSCSKKKKVESSTDRQTPEKNESSSREEENLLEKSRSILEAKAKLYEEILSTGERAALADDDDEQDDRAFLVDFQKKIYENNEKTSKIEFIDDDGRIRFFEPEKYQSLTEEQRKASEQRLASRNTAQQIEQVERAHREQMRSKWEADIEQLRNKNQIHYQDLLFDEVRQHGVSYFQFSTDEKLRAEQMTTLNEIREKTQVEQRKSAQEKDFRQVTINERLKKIRERKAKEMGIQLDRDGTPIPISQKIQTTIESKTPQIPQETRQTEVEPKVQNESTTKLTAPVQMVKPVGEKTEPNKEKSASNSSFSYPFPVIRPRQCSTNKETLD